MPTCALALGSRGYAVEDGRSALVLSIGSARSIVVTQPIQLRSDFMAFRFPPTKHTDELLLLPTFQEACPDKTKFWVTSESGTAFGLSSFLTFVSRRSLALRSAPSVNPACAALRGAYPKTPAVLASAPLRAPLRSGD